MAGRTVRGHKVDREQVVDRVAVLPLEAAHAASERQAADACVADDSDRAAEAVFLRGSVQLLEERAAFHFRDPLGWIDFYRAHAREIDHHAAVAGRESGHAVAATADRDDKVVLARETHRHDDILDTRAPRDKRRAPVGDRVPDDPACVVVAIARLDELSAEFLS
jgi:hypothetical protein